LIHTLANRLSRDIFKNFRHPSKVLYTFLEHYLFAGFFPQETIACIHKSPFVFLRTTLAFAKPSLKDTVVQGNLKKHAFPVLFQRMLIFQGMG